MKLIFGLMLALPMLVHAQDRRQLENRVTDVLRLTQQSLNRNIQYLDERELRHVEQLLIRANEAAQVANRPEPRPNPTPRPQRVMVCANDHVATFQSTFAQIKTFAYNVANLGSTASIEYATEWTNRHPCHLASKFIADFTRIKTHAYNNMNMGTIASVQYSEEMVSRVCSEVQFEQIFNQHKAFAYNTLNMGTTASVQYAQPKMESEAFICRNF